MRLPRLYAPGLPQLAVAYFSEALKQKWGTVIDSEEFDRIAKWVDEAARDQAVRLHAWTLTPVALRLVATPPDKDALSRLIQSIGRRLGATHRDGPVFQGRYRSALLEPGAWVMPAIIWVENAPWIEGWAPNPLAWRWSSSVVHAGSDRGLMSVFSFHHDYWVCGNTPFDRQAKHHAALMRGLSASEGVRIERAIQGQWALGCSTFTDELGAVATRRVTPARRGRPRKQPSAASKQ